MSDDIETHIFTAPIQKKIFAMLLFDADAFPLNAEAVKSEYFDNVVLKDFIDIIRGYYKKYNKVPTKDEFREEVILLLGKNEKLPEDEYIGVMSEVFELGEEGDFDWVRDQVVDFARSQAVKMAVLVGIKTSLKKGDYGGFINSFQKAASIGETGEDLGTFIYKDKETLRQRLDDREKKYDRSIRGIPTGLATIDSHLNGGICPQEVGAIMGPLKRGKTTVAANFTKGALNKGIDVVHYSFESNIYSTQETYDSMISGVPRRELMNRRDEVEAGYKDFFDRPRIGQLLIKHFPASSSTAWTIESHLYKLKSLGINPKLLILDYVSLMRPIDKTAIGRDNTRYETIGQIIKEVISLAQRKNMAIWLLCQSKGGAKTKYAKGGRIGTDDTADSQEIPRHVDIFLSLNQTSDEIKNKKMAIYAAGGRSVEDDWEVVVEYDKNKAQIWEEKIDVR